MKGLFSTSFSLLAGLTISLFVVWILGENPFHVLGILWNSAFGNLENFYGTLSYATPLIFTGLSVAVAFHCGLFNIGGEGQLYVGSLFLTAFTLKYDSFPSFIGIVLCILASIIGGGFWGGMAGYLKAKRGSHEVIVTIMLNFISYALCSYVILNKIKNPLSQNPESAEITNKYWLNTMTESTSLNTSFLVALAAIAIVWILLFRTTWGFEVRLIGSSLETATRSGISSAKRITQAMFISGALSGLVSLHEILGHTHKFKDQFSPGYGFLGIAVALLARNKPIWIFFSALLFGALSKGSLDLELDTEKITRDMALMIQGLMILFIASQYYWENLGRFKNARH